MSVFLFCEQFVDMLNVVLRHTNHETEFLYSCFALRTANEYMKGRLAVMSKWVCKQTCYSL